MRKAIVVLSVLTMTGFTPSKCPAWNDAGHKTVALFAYRELRDDGTRNKIIAILEKHPHADSFLKNGVRPGTDRYEWMVMQAATWPDWVRPKKGHPRPDVDKYHKPEWHFIDKPFVLAGDLKQSEEDLQPKEPHVVWALKKKVAELKADDTSEEDRAVALCWLLHLVGDIHQPLHAATLYSDEFPPPEGDRGGNSIFIPNSKHMPELHAYWDNLLGHDARYPTVDLAVEDLRRSGRFSRDSLKKYLEKSNFEDWANESHYYARRLAYSDGKLRGVPIALERRHEVDHVDPLTPEYERNALQVARQRGALAGFRLADQLQAVLKGQE